MLRFLYLLLLIMLSYFSLRSRFRAPRMPSPRKDTPQVPDMNFPEEAEMVQDPVCGTYVEAKSALVLVHDGNRIYFCSDNCRKCFLESRPQSSRPPDFIDLA